MRGALQRGPRRAGIRQVLGGTADLPRARPLTEALDPVTRRLGWRTKLKLEPFLEATDFNVEEMYKVSKLSLYTVVVGVNQKESIPG